jgi:pyrroline-5-carboxylate reductase
MSAWPQTLVLVGAGKMGGAMLRGWLAGGLPAAGVALIDPAPAPEMVALAASHGLAVAGEDCPETLEVIREIVMRSDAPID